MSSNGFLNKAFMSSQKPKGDSASPTPTTPRIPMTYVHAHEIDTDYELSGASFRSLPWSIRSWLKSHNSRARVLVTTDRKTGTFIRGTIKVCLAHLDVYSPRTEFDYRVSINVEMPVGDEWRSMVAAMDAKPPHRTNDRLSFKHLLYQIDLSRLTSPGANKVYLLNSSSKNSTANNGFITDDGNRTRPLRPGLDGQSARPRAPAMRLPAQRVRESGPWVRE